MKNDFNEIQKKYRALQLENIQLKEEIERLRQQLGIVENYLDEPSEEIVIPPIFEPIPEEAVTSAITQNSTPSEKIQLFLSLFKGRDDVFARRWENQKKETSGFFTF